MRKSEILQSKTVHVRITVPWCGFNLDLLQGPGAAHILVGSQPISVHLPLAVVFRFPCVLGESLLPHLKSTGCQLFLLCSLENGRLPVSYEQLCGKNRVLWCRLSSIIQTIVDRVEEFKAISAVCRQ